MFLIKKKQLNPIVHDWIGREEAAEILRVDARTLYRWREAGFGPTFRKHKNWEVRYSKAEVMQWAATRHRRRPRTRRSLGN
jgi:hypothetical protein